MEKIQNFHQSGSVFLFSNVFFQNAILPTEKENMVLDIILDAESNATISNAMFWRWDKYDQGEPVIQFTRRSIGAAGLNINSTFTNAGLKETLIRTGGNGYRNGDVKISESRIPDSLGAEQIAAEGKVWFSNSTLVRVDGINKKLHSN